MDTLEVMRTFTRVVDARSFSAAARKMSVAVSSVTRQINALEAALGVKLLRRSTRALKLTDAGETYYASAARILADVDDVHASLRGLDASPRGILRVTMPIVFGRLHVAPCLPTFLATYRQMEVDMVLSDVALNLVDDRLDLAIRVGSIAEGNFVARKLAPHRRVVCASPSYLAEHGTPVVPGDLANHACLCFTYGPQPKTWRFRSATQTEDVRVRGGLRANSSDVLCTAAIRGAGLVLMPTWVVSRHLQQGKLKAVLTDFEASPGPLDTAIYAVFPQTRRNSQKVRCFIRTLTNHIGDPPYWDEGLPFYKHSPRSTRLGALA